MIIKRGVLAALIFAVCGLIFYAVGIVTNLFASSVFSMFWVINIQTAYLLAYLALAVAAVLTTLVAATAVYFKMQNPVPETPTNPNLKTAAIINSTAQNQGAATQIDEDTFSPLILEKSVTQPFLTPKNEFDSNLKAASRPSQPLVLERKLVANGEEDIWKRYFKTK